MPEIAQVFVVWLRLARVGRSPKSGFMLFFFFVFEDEPPLTITLFPAGAAATTRFFLHPWGVWSQWDCSKLVRTASKDWQFWQEEQARSWSGKAFFYDKWEKWIRNGDKNIYIHSYISVCVPGRVMLRLQLNQVRRRRQNIHYEHWEQFCSWIYVFPCSVV